MSNAVVNLTVMADRADFLTGAAPANRLQTVVESSIRGQGKTCAELVERLKTEGRVVVLLHDCGWVLRQLLVNFRRARLAGAHTVKEAVEVFQKPNRGFQLASYESRYINSKLTIETWLPRVQRALANDVFTQDGKLKAEVRKNFERQPLQRAIHSIENALDFLNEYASQQYKLVTFPVELPSLQSSIRQGLEQLVKEQLHDREVETEHLRICLESLGVSSGHDLDAIKSGPSGPPRRS